MMSMRISAALAIVILLAVSTGCGGSSASAPMAYRYGDMFTDDHEGSPPPPPPRSAPAPTVAHAPPPAPPADMAAGTGGRGRRVAREEQRSYVMEADSEPAAEESAAYDDEDGGMSGLADNIPVTVRPEPTERPPAGGETDGTDSTAPGPGSPQQAPEAADAPSRTPMLIYEAELNLAVREVQEKVDEVVGISNEVGGFVLNQDDNSVIIRVPAGRFREVMERIESIGDVLNRRVTAQDVSEQMRDLRIRLRNAVQMRERFAVLLARAQTIPESLAIEREIERLTETIELIRGQLIDLQGRISFSTITVRFQAIQEERQVPRERFRLPFPWLEQLGLQHLMQL